MGKSLITLKNKMQTTLKKTLVLGASENPERYSNKAIHSLLKHGHEVVAIGRKSGNVGGVTILTERPVITNLDTITLYLSKKNQEFYYDYLIGLKPIRIIFNPGAENQVLYNLCVKNDIEPVNACTLVMLSIGVY